MEVSDIVRIGTVSSVNSSDRTVRVIFKDKDMVSGHLKVLRQPMTIETKTAENHRHSADLGEWLPKVNDVVLVLYMPVFNGDGYVLGRL